MPRARTFIVALVAGLAVGVYLQRWVGWPTYLAVAVGAVMVVFILLVASSVGHDDAAADAAWRAAAPDLSGHDPALKAAATAADVAEEPR
jgi:predicted MFS family arabinose efflux permease